MARIYNWFARIFHSRVKELERELDYANESADNMVAIVGRLNNQVYYLNEQIARQKTQIEELQQILRQNT
jgi:peptidoglycan hydrolase CwlO-like protein